MSKAQKPTITKMRAERIRRGWSQQFLAMRARVGVADVSRIENCRLRPYAQQARKLARALGLRVDELQQPARLKVGGITTFR